MSQVNRATSETLRQQATQEGLVPLKAWVKNALDHVIQECMGEPGLEFVWVGDDAVDPLQQAQTLNILVGAGIKTREEARADLGLGAAGGKPQAGLGTYNQNHDEQGRFSTAEDAVAVVGHPARKPRPTSIQVAQTSEPLPPRSAPEPASRPSELTASPREGQGAETSPKEEAAPGSAPSGAESTAGENSPGDSDSTDQNEDIEFGSTRDPQFANGKLLTYHFTKHGNDFGASTEFEYEQQAQKFLTDRDNPDILDFTRAKGSRSGDIVRFNPATDEFGAITRDGKIRTYFRPDPKIHGKPTNRDYFNYEREQSR